MSERARRVVGAGVVLAVHVAGAASASAQCSPEWSRTIGMPGLSDGYAGPMTAWNDGGGEKLFVGGSFTSAAGQQIRGIGRYNPATETWAPVAGGCFSQFTNYFVAAMTAHDDGNGESLFVGGSFATAGNVAGTLNFARFDGTAWHSVAPALSGAVWSLASWGGSLYVGGGFAMAGGTTVNGIARWDGDAWNAVGTGYGGGFAPNVFALRAFDDGTGEKLYAGGRFSSIGGISGLVARWNGTAWEAAGGGVFAGSTFAGIETMAVFDEDGDAPFPPALYAGGRDLTIVGNPTASVVKWNGVAWQPVGQYLGGRTTSLAVFDDGTGPALYAGGTAQPGISYLAKLVNNEWVPAFGGISGAGIPPSDFPSVFGLYAWGDDLVVGGSFVQVGDKTNGGGAANGVAIVRGCPSSCPADFNADDAVNSQDFFDFLTAFFDTEPSADFNEDGVVNSQDFFDFLTAFFKGC